MKRFILVLAMLAFIAPANATVNSSTNKTTVLGTGAQTAFSFNFIGVASAYISVLLTDSAGVQTLLSQGSGTTQYTISLNPAVQGAIWGLGGTVTYNPSGTPIPVGSSLTIFRTLPLTQAVTLQNLSSIAILGKGAETGLDIGVMQGQQISETNSRAIVANIANSAAPLPLPPAAQLANQGLCGDSTGLNIIGCSLPASGVISSAMQPVVSAATVALGRTAMGLGSMAVENINAGTCGGRTLRDDGFGNARVVSELIFDVTDTNVDCNYSMTQRVANGVFTYTLPRGNTLFAGFYFKIYVTTGIISIKLNSNDNFPGVPSGGTVQITAGSGCQITTDAGTSAVWQLKCTTSPPYIAANAATNALTITVAGSLVNFRSTTLSTGSPLWAIPTGSITIPSGATLGTSSNVPFRVWIFAAYNSATPVLGVVVCSITTAIYPCAAWENIRKSGTAITAGSGSAGVLYTASTVTNDSVRIIGYVEYPTGLGTAGTWSAGPTTIQLCIAPFSCKRPGDVVQTVYATTTTPTAIASGTPAATAVVASITMLSASNLVKVSANGAATTIGTLTATAPIITARLYRNTGAVAVGNTALCSTSVRIVNPSNASGGGCSLPNFAFDGPASSNWPATQYGVYVANTAEPTISWTYLPATTTGNIVIEEIMGSIEPANNNEPLLMTG